MVKDDFWTFSHALSGHMCAVVSDQSRCLCMLFDSCAASAVVEKGDRSQIKGCVSMSCSSANTHSTPRVFHKLWVRTSTGTFFFGLWLLSPQSLNSSKYAGTHLFSLCDLGTFLARLLVPRALNRRPLPASQPFFYRSNHRTRVAVDIVLILIILSLGIYLIWSGSCCRPCRRLPISHPPSHSCHHPPHPLSPEAPDSYRKRLRQVSGHGGKEQ